MFFELRGYSWWMITRFSQWLTGSNHIRTGDNSMEHCMEYGVTETSKGIFPICSAIEEKAVLLWQQWRIKAPGWVECVYTQHYTLSSIMEELWGAGNQFSTSNNPTIT